jgi:hypothetical protein
MQKKFLRTLFVPASLLFSFIGITLLSGTVSGMAVDEAEWQKGLAHSRLMKYHGKKFVEPVYRGLRALPAVYAVGDMADLERRAPSLEFDRWSIGGSAMDAMKMIVGVAFGSAGQGVIPAWVAEKIPNELGWTQATAGGTMGRTVLEFYTPIKKNLHLLFSAEIRKHELVIENGSSFGIDYKKFRLSNLRGTFGVLYFSTNPNQNLFN